MRTCEYTSMNCERIDAEQALEAIQRTRETGNEHAFVVCSDGSTSETVSGSRRKVSVSTDMCDGNAGIFHVHPNDVMHFSDPDMETLDHGKVEMICVGDTQGNRKCELDGDGPIAFDEVAEFSGVEENPGEQMIQLSAPQDVVLWSHSKVEGCRCSS